MIKPCINIGIECPLIPRPIILPPSLEHRDIVFVGECGGATEVIKNDYFIGTSGQKLRQAIKSIGLDNTYKFINCILCNPLNNETPNKTIIKNCNSFFKSNLEQIKPKIVVLLGNSAIQAYNYAYKTKIPNVTESRGQIFILNEYKVICTFHPSYILRNRGTSVEQLWIGDLQHIANLYYDKSNDIKQYIEITVDNEDKYKNAIAYLSQQKLIAVDIETTGLDFESDVICISISTEYNAFCFFLNDLNLLGYQPLKDILANCNISKVLQNGKFDYLHLTKLGIIVNGIKDDTLILHYLKSGMASKGDIKHSLDKVGWELGCPIIIPTIDYSDMVNISKETLAHYAMSDVLTTFYIYKKMKSMSTPLPQYQSIVERLSERLTEVSIMLAHIESYGLKIDKIYFETLKTKYENDINTSMIQLSQIVNKDFNVKSPKQIREILASLDVELTEKTEKDNLSTSKDVLKRLLNTKLDDKATIFLNKFLEIKELKDILSSFIEPILKIVNKESIIRSSFNLHTTRSGRISSSAPKRDNDSKTKQKRLNLQNIPTKNKDIKKGIIPKLDTLLELDFKLMEFRIMAYLAKETTMLEVFSKGEDIHKINTAFLLNKPIDEVTPTERREGKTTGFAIIYGMGAKSLANELGCNEEEAQKKIDSFFMKYPKIKKFANDQLLIAKNYNYVTIPSGRVRFFTTKEKENYGELRRKSFNTPIQGFASDIALFSIFELWKWLKTNNFKSHIVNVVHDSALLDVKNEELDTIKNKVKEILCNGYGLVPPNLLDIDIKVMKNWADV